MRAIWMVFPLLLACGQKQPAQPAEEVTAEPEARAAEPETPVVETREEPEAVDEAAKTASEIEACMADCTRQNMARAVSAETIEADCRKQCDPAAAEDHPLASP